VDEIHNWSMVTHDAVTSRSSLESYGSGCTMIVKESS
jgi:hypothetical protein